LYKINFLNDENSQDGEQLASLGASLGFTYAEFDDEYLYTIMADWGTGAHDYISIFDLNGKYLDSYHAGRGEDIVSLKIENVKDNKVKMNFNREYMSFSTPTEIIFNKETNKFEEQD